MEWAIFSGQRIVLTTVLAGWPSVPRENETSLCPFHGSVVRASVHTFLESDPEKIKKDKISSSVTPIRENERVKRNCSL